MSDLTVIDILENAAHNLKNLCVIYPMLRGDFVVETIKEQVQTAIRMLEEEEDE